MDSSVSVHDARRCIIIVTESKQTKVTSSSMYECCYPNFSSYLLTYGIKFILPSIDSVEPKTLLHVAYISEGIE